MRLKKNPFFFGIVLMLALLGCDDHLEESAPPPLPDAVTALQGKVAIKVLPRNGGLMTLLETLQPQYLITNPKREIAWLKDDLSEISSYVPSDGWTLVDAVTHPSGHTSAASIKVDLSQGFGTVYIKVLRFKTDGTSVEFELAPLSLPSPPQPTFIGTLDRVRLAVYEEDLFVTARWAEHQLQAYCLSFEKGRFVEKWTRWVEPPAYLGIKGIIGGGFDNFHQGEYYHFVYSGVDKHGNLYVAVPSSEDVLAAHDSFFGDNLMQHADPSIYEYGVAVVTKFSPHGDRLSSALIGNSLRGNKYMLNMRVSDDGNVYLVGRIKMNSEPNGWDAWLLAAEPVSGTALYERIINIKDGDMLWDIAPLPDGTLLAAGTTGYTQNTSGLSVSDARAASAILLDAQGQLIREIDLPQGPAARGSEAMSVNLLGNRNVILSGAHNAPGTHAAVFADGFVAVRSF